MIFEIFSPKNLAKKLAFLTQNKRQFCRKSDHNIGIKEKRQFFRRKSPKIVIITLLSCQLAKEGNTPIAILPCGHSYDF
jgi:hypothetical protein